jgi:hypothetical protein
MGERPQSSSEGGFQTMTDIFGDLRGWGQVLRQIEQLKSAGRLDEHQEGLIRVLRYRYNCQLRQAALRAAPDIRRPSQDLLDVLLQIVTDEYCDLETRILACDAVRHSISRHRDQGGGGDFESKAAQRAKEILRVPQPPVLREAVDQWLVPMREPAAQPAQAGSR